MPALFMPLCALREGKLVVALAEAYLIDRTPEHRKYQHPDSKEFRRGVVLMYGALKLADEQGVYMLDDGKLLG
jgi:hypothetical protein